MPRLPSRLAGRCALALAFATLMGVGLAGWAEGFGEPEPLSTAAPDPAIRERIRVFESALGRLPLDVMSFPGPDQRPVYLFHAPCCDQFNRLYDAEGRFICAPTGGFGGSGDGRCPAWVHALMYQGVVRVPAPAGEQPRNLQVHLDGEDNPRP